MKEIRLKEALKLWFINKPNWVFGIQDLCVAVQEYFTFSPFQQQLDPKYPQRRYEHEIRSTVSRLKNERFILYVSRNKYKLL